MIAASPNDFRALARRRLPRFLFDYIDGGSYGEATLQRNIDDLASLSLRQRVLSDVSTINLGTELFGRQYSLPIVLGPVGLAGMNARRGEAQAARAADAAGIAFCLSTVSVCPLNEIKAAVVAPFWFQLYMVRDRGFVTSLMQQAEAAGCNVLVFTVDMPMPGARYRDRRSGLSGTPGWRGALRRAAQATTHPRWAWDVGLRGRPHHLGNVTPILDGKTGIEDFLGWMAANFDPSVSWDDIAYIRKHWPHKLVIKGILDAEDARIANGVGADGIVVSNHGGRQLDSVVSTAKALPAIVDAVGGDLTILADGGVRSGLDTIKMLALGADGILLGRSWAYALAAGGQAAITQLIDLFAAEMKIALALTGTCKVSAISKAILEQPLK